MMEKEKIRIEAIIRNGDRKYYVINRPLQKSYTKIDYETIIGEDEGALTFFKREFLTLPFGKTAFGGRKFTLPLTDGTVEKCWDQWWDGMTKSAEELFSFDELTHFAWSTAEELKTCYVFYGGECEATWLEKLEAEYQGKVYDYNEYEKIIKAKK